MNRLFHKVCVTMIMMTCAFKASSQNSSVHVTMINRFTVWNVKANQQQQLNCFEDGQKLAVIVFLSPECPLCKNYSLTLNQLSKEYSSSVRIVGIIPGKAYSTADVKEYIDKYKINFDIFIDSSKSISDVLEAKVTPEVFLFRKDRVILYHGAIDNWIKQLGMQSAMPTEFYLRDAVDMALSDKPVLVQFKKPVGC